MAGSVWKDLLVGIAAGAAASWVMEKAQARIMSAGSDATRAREKEAQGDLKPATYEVANRAVRAVGRSIPDARQDTAAELVHYATGAAFGAVYALVARRAGLSPLLLGAAFGAAVWLVNDEALVPALGFSRAPWRYPASTHAKALASHLVYGTATAAGVNLASRTLH